MSKALQNLCFKLNVPCDIVFGYSACEGLKKILESTDKRESIYQKHVDVIDELLGLVQEQIQTKEDTLFKDFLFYNFIVKDFPVWLFRVSYRRFELAMNNEKYTLLELLDFAKKLRAVETSVFNDVKYRQFELLLTSIWNQISMQEHLITSSVLARMYKEAPTNNVRVFQKLHTAFLKHISALDLKNVLMILNVKEPLDHSKKLSTIAMWIVSTFEDRTVNDLENLMSGYLQYSYVCPEMMKTLKQIVQSVHSKKNMTPKLMCQIISYCKKGLHYDHWLLKKACSHYIDNTEHYTSENLHSLLEAIGVLNYIPESEKVFFTEVEEYLTKNFYNIEISLLLDMFVYLIYLDKPAVNFLPCIFAPVLTNFVYEFEGEKKKRAAENLHLIRTAFKRHSLSPMVLPFDIDNTPSLIDTNNRIVYDTLIDVLRNSKYVKLGRRPTFIGESYFIMNFTDLAVWADVKIPETRNKFAILIVTENSYCKNISDQMLGYEAANIRILTRIGVTVAQINYRQIERLREKNQLSGFLTSLLMQQVLDTADLLMLEETAEDIEDSDMSDLIYAE